MLPGWSICLFTCSLGATPTWLHLRITFSRSSWTQICLHSQGSAVERFLLSGLCCFWATSMMIAMIFCLAVTVLSCLGPIFSPSYTGLGSSLQKKASIETWCHLGPASRCPPSQGLCGLTPWQTCLNPRQAMGTEFTFQGVQVNRAVRERRPLFKLKTNSSSLWDLQ
jgi:hypothetical protein